MPSECDPCQEQEENKAEDDAVHVYQERNPLLPPLSTRLNYCDGSANAILHAFIIIIIITMQILWLLLLLLPLFRIAGAITPIL